MEENTSMGAAQSAAAGTAQEAFSGGAHAGWNAQDALPGAQDALPGAQDALPGAQDALPGAQDAQPGGGAGRAQNALPGAAQAAPAASAPEEDGGRGSARAQQARPAQTARENARFAAMRRQQEAHRREEQMFRDIVGDMPNPATGRPFADKNEFMAWKQDMELQSRARAAQVTPEAYKRLEERLRAEIKATDPDIRAQADELQRHRQREAQAQFRGDLAAIRRAYPDEEAKSVEELGVDFLRLCAGGVAPLTAYEAIRAQRARGAKSPPSMGDVRTGGARERDFFTRDEVARMSREEVHRNFAVIRRSMGKWK